MKSIRTPWTKTGRTTREVVATVGGPSKMKADLTVPSGVECHFIGRWVVGDLRWLAKQAGERSSTYHDADHYGIQISPDDVADIKEVVR